MVTDVTQIEENAQDDEDDQSGPVDDEKDSAILKAMLDRDENEGDFETILEVSGSKIEEESDDHFENVGIATKQRGGYTHYPNASTGPRTKVTPAHYAGFGQASKNVTADSEARQSSSSFITTSTQPLMPPRSKKRGRIEIDSPQMRGALPPRTPEHVQAVPSEDTASIHTLSASSARRCSAKHQPPTK